MLRKLAGFLIAPFPIALFQSAVVGVWPKVGKGVFEHPVSMFVAMCLYYYIFGLLIGLPGWLILRRRNPKLRAYAVLGFIAAILPISAGMLILAIRGQNSIYIFLYNSLLFGCGGIVAGALFWWVGVRRPKSVRLAQTFD